MISWTLRDRAVRLSRDWEATMVTNGGYDTARGRAPEADVSGARQGDILTAYRTDASVMWQGRLTNTPTIRNQVAILEAGGFSRSLRKASRPLLYRFDDEGAWVPGDADPHLYGASEKYDTQINPGRITFGIAKDETYADATRCHAALWLEGNRINRLEYDWAVLNNTGNFDIKVWRAMGPSGTLALEHSKGLGGSVTSGTVNVDLSGNADLVLIGLQATAASSPNARNKVNITGLRVWGRVTSGPLTASDVVADVGSIAGLDPDGVRDSNLGVLPLFFEVGNNADRLDFLAQLEDSRWLVLEKQGSRPWLDYGPYETTWRVAEERGATYDLIDQERFNEARVYYRAPSGRSRTAVAEADAEITYTNTAEFEWELPQAGAGLAASVAERLVDRLSRRRVAGSVMVREARDARGTYRSGHDIMAGDLLDMVDQPHLPPQRIVRVSYREGSATCDLESDISLTSLLKGRVRRRLVRSTL